VPDVPETQELKPFLLSNLPEPDPTLTFSALGFTKNPKPEEVKDANDA